MHKISKSCSGVNTKYDSTESSSQSSSEDIPSLSFVRSSRKIQKHLDDRIAQIEKASESKGNDTPKIKSKRGIVEVLVSKKVSWPHDTILGGSTKQHVTCYQLTITQCMQGFTLNILNEDCHETRERMLWYLSDLMEDATDFSCGSAKESHAILLC